MYTNARLQYCMGNDLTVYFTDYVIKCVYVKCELHDILKWYSILFRLDRVDSLANTHWTICPA